MMEGNIEDPISPADLAEEVGMSTRQLERLFRRYLNRSPKRYYMELRLQKARNLLMQTDMSVINVALACGFASPSHFSKCYRAHYNTTPYRERGTQGVPSRPGHGCRSDSRAARLGKAAAQDHCRWGSRGHSRIAAIVLGTFLFGRTALGLPTGHRSNREQNNEKTAAGHAVAALWRAPPAAEDIKIGVILGFTGPLESITADMAAGAELAMKEVNDSGKLLGGSTVTSVRGDSTCVDAAAATAAAERLVTADKVSTAIIGADCSGVTGAVLQNVARAERHRDDLALGHLAGAVDRRR